MNPKQEAVMRIIRNIYAVQDDDIQCDVVAEQMVESADSLYSDEASQRQFPAMWRHFQLCADCYAEYRMLIELVEAEEAFFSPVDDNAAAGAAEYPAVKGLVAVPDAIRRLLDAALTISFPGFTPMPADVLRGAVLAAKPVQITFPETGLQIELNVLPGLMDSAHRLLTCGVSASDLAQSKLNTRMVAQLFSETSGELEQEEEMVDRQAAFDDLYEDRYTLLLLAETHTYGVTGIDLSNI
ncbi:MAG: hypothetical protein H6641_05085 [Caldilineaceae bacterium]|nr:hypothetical protein [Caldilineaceae bacterium]